MIFGHSQGSMGWPTSKNNVLGPYNEVLKLRKLDCLVGQLQMVITYSI